MARKTHKVAIVVMCEAEGVDEHDAAAGAQMAISRLFYENSQRDKQDEVGSVRGPTCAECGISWPDEDAEADGNIRRHVSCERWSPEEIDDWPEDEPRPSACEGSGKPPRVHDEPVIGFDRPDGLAIYTRVHQVMDAGMAAGNGYLWMQPTWKAFR